MIADLQAGHRSLPTPGLIWWTSLPALAWQAVLDGRRAESELRLSQAAADFRRALTLAQQDPSNSSLTRTTLTASVAGLNRSSKEDPTSIELRPDVLASFEQADRADLDAADLADYVSLLGRDEPLRSQLVEDIVQAPRPPAWFLRQLGDGEGSPEANRALLRAAVREAPMVAVYHALLAEVDGRADADRSSDLTIAAARWLADDDREQARTAASMAYTLDPSNALAVLLQADLLRLDDDAAGAISTLEALRAMLPPESPLVDTVVRALALAQEGVGRRKDALETLGKVLDGSDARSSDFVFAGRLLTVQGDPSRARVCFDQALDIDPDDTSVVYASVKSWMREGQHDRAVADVSRALRRRPAEPLLYLLLGFIMVRAGQCDSPDQQIAEVTELGLDQSEAWRVLSLLYSDQGDRRGEANSLARALKLQHSKDPDLLARRGTVLLELGSQSEAIRLLRQAVRKRPDDASLLVRLADALLALDRPDEALAVLDKAIRKLGDHADLLTLRGRVQHRLGVLDAAADDLRHALSLRMDVNAAAELFAVLIKTSGEKAAVTAVVECIETRDIASVAYRLWDRGQSSGAEALSAAGLAHADGASNVQRAWLLLVRGLALRDLEGRGDAEELLRAAVATAPDLAEAHVCLGDYLVAYGQEEEATAEALEARRLSPGSEFVARVAVNVLRVSKGPERALKELDEAIHQIGEDADLLIMRVDLLLDVDRNAEVLDLVSELRESGVDTWDVRRNEGTALLVLSRYEEAIPVLDRALDERPDDVSVRYNLALALYQGGDAERAGEVLSLIPPESGEADVLLLRGQIRRALGDDTALDDLLEAVRLDASLTLARKELVDAAAEHDDLAPLARKHLDVLLADESLVDDPEVARLTWVLGQPDVALERIDRGRERLGEADLTDTELRSRLCHLLVLRSAILLEQGDVDDAVTAGRDAVAIDGSVTTARYVLSDALRAAGSFDDALVVLGSATDAELLSRRVELLLELARDREAESLVRRSITEDAQNTELALQLCDIMIGYGVLLQPTRVLTPLLANSPSATILRLAGASLSAMGEFERAVAVLELARQRDDNLPYVDAELAWAYSNLEPPPATKVIRSVDRALERQPDDLNLLRIKADTLLVAGRSTQARKLYRRILSDLSRQPTSNGASWQAGWCNYRLQDYDQALDHLLRAISMTLRRDSGDRFDLGLVLLAAGRPARAKREFENAIDEAKSLAGPLKRCGLLRIAVSDLSEIMQQTSTGPSASAARGVDAVLRKELKSARSALSKIRIFLRQVDGIIDEARPRRSRRAPSQPMTPHQEERC